MNPTLEWYLQFSQKSGPNHENRVRESEVYLRLPLFDLGSAVEHFNYFSFVSETITFYLVFTSVKNASASII